MGHPIAWESNQKREARNPKTRCPNCNSIIKVAKPRGGAVIACARCGVELEIISADPFQVGFTEDWQDEWEEGQMPL